MGNETIIGVDDGKMTSWCLLHGVIMGAKASTTVMDGNDDDIDAPMAKKMPTVIVSGIMATTVDDAQFDRLKVSSVELSS